VSLFDNVPMPEEITKLPTNGTFTLTSPVRVDAQDLQRFMDAGGTIIQAGYRLFIDDPTKIIARNVARMAEAPPNSHDSTGVLKSPPTKRKAKRRDTTVEDRVRSIMAPFAKPWRWFCDGDWIVLEPPQGLIAAETMHHVHQCTDVHTVEAVFRATPNPGIYLRFRLRDLQQGQATS